MAPTRVGPYELLGPLGAGGFGTVHRARHVELGVVRAVKVVKTSLDSLGRFAREVRALARVRHPNVVTIHEASDPPGPGEGAPVAWLAMALVEGQTLEAALARGRFPLEQALDVTAQVARGLDALHEVGVVHRDVKPANVLLTPEGRAVLVDLGLALTPAADERLTRSSAVVGTPLYLAPELLVGGAPTPATDVHALGLLLHELATGTPAYLGADGDPRPVLARILAQRRPRPSEVDPTLPPALDDLVARATALDPAARPPRAGAFADLVDALRAGAYAPRRRRSGWALAALVGAGLLGAALLGAGLLGAALLGGAPRRATAARGAPRPTAASVPSPARALDDPPGAVTSAGELLARADRQARAGRRPLVRLQHPKGTGPVRARFVDAGRVLTLGEKDGRVRLWSLGATSPPAEGLTAPVAVALEVVGERVVVQAGGSLVALRAPGLAIERTVSAPPLRGLTRAQGGALLALLPAEGGGAGQAVRLDDLTLERWPAATLPPAQQPATTVCGSGRWLLVGVGSGEFGQTSELLTFDQPGGRLLRTEVVPSRLTCAAAHPTVPDRFALGFASGAVVLHTAGRVGADLRLVAPRAVLERPGLNDEAHATSVRGVTFTPDGRRLASAASGNPDPTRTELRWWDATTGAPLGELGEPPGVLDVEASPDGQLVVVGTRESWAEVWAAPP